MSRCYAIIEQKLPCLSGNMPVTELSLLTPLITKKKLSYWSTFFTRSNDTDFFKIRNKLHICIDSIFRPLLYIKKTGKLGISFLGIKTSRWLYLPLAAALAADVEFIVVALLLLFTRLFDPAELLWVDSLRSPIDETPSWLSCIRM